MKIFVQQVKEDQNSHYGRGTQQPIRDNDSSS